jgi:AcrR family transcriptional regulator
MSSRAAPLLPPGPALQARSRESLDRLVQAGLDILEHEGPDALTVGAVAERAGLAVGTVYRRFGNKERMLATLQFEFIQRLDAGIDRQFGAARDTKLGDAERIRIAVQAVSRGFERHARLLGVFLLLGTSNDGVVAEGTRASAATNVRFQAALNGIAVAHPDRDAALDMAFRTVYAMCAHRVTHGASHESDRPLPWPAFHDELAVIVQRYLL